MSNVALPWEMLPGTANNVNHVMDNDKALRNKINGNIDADNLSSAVGASLGLSAGPTARRGSTNIAAEQSTSSTSYTTLTTPDRVSGIVLPTDGLIFIAYSALWKESTTTAARAAIFIGANQLKVFDSSNFAPSLTAAATNGGGGANYAPLFTIGQGLASAEPLGVNYSSHVTTGQSIGHISPDNGNEGIVLERLGSSVMQYESTTVAGGWTTVFAAAGTYDISVQFKASTGSVTVKERKLWVWTVGF